MILDSIPGIEYQHFEDVEDGFAEYGFHRRIFSPPGPNHVFLPDSYAGYPTFFPGQQQAEGGYEVGGPRLHQGPPRHHQTLAEALRQQEQSVSGFRFSGSVSNPIIGVVHEEEEPIPGFPIFTPRQTMSSSGTNTNAAAPEGTRRPPRQKPRVRSQVHPSMRII